MNEHASSTKTIVDKYNFSIKRLKQIVMVKTSVLIIVFFIIRSNKSVFGAQSSLTTSKAELKIPLSSL